MALILIISVSIFIGVVSYYLWHWTYWLRRGIPGPLGYPVIGVCNTTFSPDYPPFLKIKEWGEKYGPLFGFTEGVRKNLIVSDLDLVHEIFIKQFDNFYGRKLHAIHGDPEKDKMINLFVAQGYRWKRLRTISSPTFSNNNLRRMTATIEGCAVELMKHIERMIEERSEEERYFISFKGGRRPLHGKQMEMLTLYQEYSLDVIGRIAMGQTDSQMFKNPLLPHVQSIFGEGWKNIFMIGAIAPKIIHLMIWVMETFNFSHPFIFIERTIEKAVRTRIEERNSGVRFEGDSEDFIDLFLDAKAENEDLLDADSEVFSKKNYLKITKNLTLEEIVAECIVFFIAGFDTTALSLSFSTYLLAINSDIQRKVQEELDRECPDSEITFNQLAKLKYLEAVIKETLRLYPLAAPANSRTCMKDTVIGKDGILIEKGTVVAANSWAIQTDPKIWGEDAEEFRPERWLNSDQSFPKEAFLPFGLGPRQCIGMRLAYMEAKMALAHILRKYTFSPGPLTQVPLRLRGRATTHPESVIVYVNPRIFEN